MELKTLFQILLPVELQPPLTSPVDCLPRSATSGSAPGLRPMGTRCRIHTCISRFIRRGRAIRHSRAYTVNFNRLPL